MPQISDVSFKLTKNGGHQRVVWSACVDCGKERWVRVVKGVARTMRCHSCAQAKMVQQTMMQRYGKDHIPIKGIVQLRNGYALVRVPPGSFFYPMVKKDGYVLEHRLVMAQSLKRCLLTWEVVHHKNGIKDDNRLENLQLLSSRSVHAVDTVKKSELVRLTSKIKELEAKLQEIGISHEEWAKANHYVKLAEDQELSSNPHGKDVHLDAGKYDGLYRKRYAEAQQDMLSAGWRKVVPE